MKSSIAIMQPYFFPYLGYIQLINAVDKFVFYDDVNYIKNGWINRNKILINNTSSYITVKLKEASPFKQINQIEFIDNRQKIGKSIELAYKKAPFFNNVWPFVLDCLNFETNSISELAIRSLLNTCDYLGLKKEFEVSSVVYSETKDLPKADRIIKICNLNGRSNYINSIGGINLYNKKYFYDRNVNLFFLKPTLFCYDQGIKDFIFNLSILDIMMFNSSLKIKEQLNNYELI